MWVPVVALAEWTGAKREHRSVTSMLRWLAPGIVLTGVYAAAHEMLVHGRSVLGYVDAGLLRQARWASWTLFPQELAFLWPFYPHSPQVAVHVPASGNAPEVIGGAIALLAAFGLLGWLLRKRAPLAVPVGLFILTVLPLAWAMWSRAYLALGERVLYLPSAGAALALALGMGAIERSPSLAANWRWPALSIALALVASSCWATARLLPAWQNDFTIYQAIESTQPNNPTGYIGRAQQLAQQGHTQEALAELDLAERKNAQLPEIPTNRAMIALSVGDWAGALAQSERALAIDHKNGPARTLHAMALLRLRRLPEASAELEQLLREDPTNTQAESLYGQCLFLANRPADALVHLERIAGASTGDPSILFALGQCYARLNRPADARREFEACLAIDDGDPGAWHRLADVCRQLGDTAAADHALARVNQLMGPGPGNGQPPGAATIPSH